METSVVSVTDLPDWMQPTAAQSTPLTSSAPLVQTAPSAPSAPSKITLRELELITYGNAFESALEKISKGQSLSSIINEDQRTLDYGAFLRWIHKDPIRKNRYYEAQEIGAEIVAGEMLQIADAENSLEDVQRSTLRISTRKYLLGVWNKRRFGEVKQIEHSGAISITQAIQDAQNRVFEGYATIAEVQDAETDL